MHHTMRLWAAAGIIAVVVIAGFAISVPRTRDLPITERGGSVATPGVPVVKIRDAYARGVHTITGSVRAPNACAAVVASATLEGGSNTARIVVAVSLPTDTGICLQVPTDIGFKVTVEGPASVPITATVNGEVASTTQS